MVAPYGPFSTFFARTHPSLNRLWKSFDLIVPKVTHKSTNFGKLNKKRHRNNHPPNIRLQSSSCFTARKTYKNIFRIASSPWWPHSLNHSFPDVKRPLSVSTPLTGFIPLYVPPLLPLFMYCDMNKDEYQQYEPSWNAAEPGKHWLGQLNHGFYRQWPFSVPP